MGQENEQPGREEPICGQRLLHASCIGCFRMVDIMTIRIRTLVTMGCLVVIMCCLFGEQTAFRSPHTYSTRTDAKPPISQDRPMNEISKQTTQAAKPGEQ